MRIFLLIILALYLITRYIFPNIIPSILRFWLKRYSRNRQAGFQHTDDTPENGKITITHFPPKQSYRKQQPAGTYVEFEEINTTQEQ